MLKNPSQYSISLPALLLALAVIFGAFGAHALENVLSDYHKTVYNKANFYHFVHALGMLLVTILGLTVASIESCVKKVLILLFWGLVIFCGSLYLLALTDIRWLGAITPFGGLCFIAAWLYLAFGASRLSLPLSKNADN